MKNWTRDTNVNIVSPQETSRLFEVTADTNNDKPIQLPLIALTRNSGFSLLNTSKRPVTFDGFTLDATHEKALQLNVIPISIPYQIDIYTRYLEECDEYIRNIVFNIVNFPKLDVVIPYNSRNYKHDANIRLQSEIIDNSSIPERLIPGQFTRVTLNVIIDDAYLFDMRYRDVYEIETTTFISDNEKDDYKDNKLI